MALCGDENEHKRIAMRLKKIEGQIRGIAAMIDSNRECIEVSRQISAVSGALHGVWVQVLSDHLKGCIADALTKKDDKLVDQLIEHLKKVR